MEIESFQLATHIQGGSLMLICAFKFVLGRGKLKFRRKHQRIFLLISLTKSHQIPWFLHETLLGLKIVADPFSSHSNLHTQEFIQTWQPPSQLPRLVLIVIDRDTFREKLSFAKLVLFHPLGPSLLGIWPKVIRSTEFRPDTHAELEKVRGRSGKIPNDQDRSWKNPSDHVLMNHILKNEWE